MNDWRLRIGTYDLDPEAAQTPKGAKRIAPIFFIV
jgi:hypothetical protein